MPHEKCYPDNTKDAVRREPEWGNYERETGRNLGIYALLSKDNKKDKAAFLMRRRAVAFFPASGYHLPMTTSAGKCYIASRFWQEGYNE